jgi:NADPH2:quinone reductase
MRAVRVERFGGPEVLTVADVPDPVAGPGQVTVRGIEQVQFAPQEAKRLIARALSEAEAGRLRPVIG